MGFSGDLKDLPLEDIINLISGNGKSGLLTLQTCSHDISLVFDCGAVVSVLTSNGSFKLGQLLVSQGHLTDEQIEETLELQAVLGGTSRIGDLLVDSGRISREQIQDAMNARLEASFLRILEHSEGTFTFAPGDPAGYDPIADGLQLQSIVLNAMRLADESLPPANGTGQSVRDDELNDTTVISERSANGHNEPLALEWDIAVAEELMSDAALLDYHLSIDETISAFDPSEFEPPVDIEQPRDIDGPTSMTSVHNEDSYDENLVRWWVNFQGQVSLERLARLREDLTASPCVLETRFEEIRDGTIVLRIVSEDRMTWMDVDRIIRELSETVGLDRQLANLSL